MNFIKVYSLKQQTPMIHFQGNESGATLRASEVKPKLDNFIRSLYDNENVPPDWIISNEHNNALNYKLQIIATDNESSNNPVFRVDDKDDPKYGIGCYFFTDKKAAKEKPSSFHSDIKLKVVCFIPTLLEKIEEVICEFFATTNFGYRQNKGFGSFIIEDTETQSAIFAGKDGYYLEAMTISTKEALNYIKDFYQVVKNGLNIPDKIYKRSFLMKHYFNGHLNDKKAMKLALINSGCLLPTTNNAGICAYDDGDKNDSKKATLAAHQSLEGAEYIRGLLGFAGTYTFRSVKPNHKSNGSTTVTFTVKSAKIERFPSPILFKPILIDNKFKIFLILDNKSLNEISEQEVMLECNDVQPSVQLAVKVPKVQDNFLSDFLDSVVRANKYGLMRTQNNEQ